jgi:hypothetical protein
VGHSRSLGGAGKLKVSWQIAGEPKAARAAIRQAAEKPFDARLAQVFRRDSKEFARLVKGVETESTRRLKR